MSTENDRLLALIANGDTLQALNRLLADPAPTDPRLAINRALFGPVDDATTELVAASVNEHRMQVGGSAGPARVATLYNLGCFALQQDDVLEARLRFAEALELAPEHLMARHNLAYCHELLAESDAARAEYQAVLSQNPDCALTRLNLAQFALQEGDYEAGLEDLEALYADDPGNMGVLLYLCRGLLQRGEAADVERAMALLDQTADAERFVDLQECRAYALFKQGDLEAAEAIFRTLLEAAPDNLFALTGMIKVLGEGGATAELKGYAERYQALQPSESISALLADLAAA